MAQIEFSYNGINTIIQCYYYEKFIDVLKRLCSKINIDIFSVDCLYT